MSTENKDVQSDDGKRKPEPPSQDDECDIGTFDRLNDENDKVVVFYDRESPVSVWIEVSKEYYVDWA